MHQGFRHGAAPWRRSIAVFLFRNVFRDLDCVLAHRADAVHQLLGSVQVHTSSFFREQTLASSTAQETIAILVTEASLLCTTRAVCSHVQLSARRRCLRLTV